MAATVVHSAKAFILSRCEYLFPEAALKNSDEWLQGDYLSGFIRRTSKNPWFCDHVVLQLLGNTSCYNDKSMYFSLRDDTILGFNDKFMKSHLFLYILRKYI